MESLNGVHRRWAANDPQYKETEQRHVAQLKLSLLATIHDNAVKRKFLVHVNAKYSA